MPSICTMYHTIHPHLHPSLHPTVPLPSIASIWYSFFVTESLLVSYVALIRYLSLKFRGHITPSYPKLPQVIPSSMTLYDRDLWQEQFSLKQLQDKSCTGSGDTLVLKSCLGSFQFVNLWCHFVPFLGYETVCSLFVLLFISEVECWH